MTIEITKRAVVIDLDLSKADLFVRMMREGNLPFALKRGDGVVLFHNQDQLDRHAPLHRLINAKARFWDQIIEHMDSGMVCVREHGYDYVEHVSWESDVHEMPVREAWRRAMSFHYDSDGECSRSLEVMPWSYKGVKGNRRDLIAEAYEDGHPHCVSMVRYETV